MFILPYDKFTQDKTHHNRPGFVEDMTKTFCVFYGSHCTYSFAHGEFWPTAMTSSSAIAQRLPDACFITGDGSVWG